MGYTSRTLEEPQEAVWKNTAEEIMTISSTDKGEE